MIKVEIITIGDELLIGQIVDTNSAWIAVELNKLGFDVQYKSTIGDNETDILDAFEKAFSRASIVLVTGGIGPTKDDITKKTLCKYFNTSLVFDEKTLETVTEVVTGFGKKLNDLTKGQAYVPKACTVIQNKMGTAPATWFEKEGKILVSMPGVPYEMKWIMSNEVLPRLQKTFSISDSIQHLTFWVSNYTESLLAMHIESFENKLPEYIKLAYLPTSGLIRLRLTGKADNEALLSEEMNVQRDKLISLLSNNIVSEADENVEHILAKLLKEKGLTLSVAESCTGGKLASLFTARPGCSEYFNGGVISYSNEAKKEILTVNEEHILREGAVSQSVVEEMALGAQKLFHTNCAISTSGIAGPDGGTPEKPVGTVWIAAVYNNQICSKEFHFSNSRENNILRACNTGILMLLELLNEND